VTTRFAPEKPACLGLTDVMFPDLAADWAVPVMKWQRPAKRRRTEPPEKYTKALERAKAVCATCRYKQECDEWADQQGVQALPVGVYGGKDQRERVGQEGCGADCETHERTGPAPASAFEHNAYEEG